jgi:hypothetical protein
MNWMSKKDIQFNRKRKFSEISKPQQGHFNFKHKPSKNNLSDNLKNLKIEPEANSDSLNGNILKNRSVYKSLSKNFIY